MCVIWLGGGRERGVDQRAPILVACQSVYLFLEIFAIQVVGFFVQVKINFQDD